ncbi:MAG: LamG-like jellyroll fold domain-containing protein [Myxococcota bacterium]
MRHASLACLAVLTLGAAACTGELHAGVDSGLDGGTDAGPDGGAPADGGDVDAGALDGGDADAGPSDAGGDAGAMDAGFADGGQADGGADAGASDAGGTDAGASDAGTSDAGTAGDRPPLDGGAAGGAVAFHVNPQGQDDYGQLTQLPPGFGAGEFTFELWIRPDATLATGGCVDGTAGQRTQWCTQDPQPGSASDWWYKGNFLLDGHNNSDFGAGTFSLQFYGGGRVRWQLGDEGNAGAGGTWGVQAWPASNAPSLLDGAWHHVACVRRWQGTTSARLELWVDGVQVGSAISDVRTNLATRWANWAGFPSGQEGWFFGAEKQSAIGVLSQYEDYKGLLSELRFWTRALSSSELAPPAYARAVQGTESGLVGWFRFAEGTGLQACDSLGATRCLTFVRPRMPFWH